MTTVEDNLSDDEAKAIEQAERRSKRRKTKYGNGVNGSSLDGTAEGDADE